MLIVVFSASENHVSSNAFVCLLHGCQLEVMRNLVQIIRDANVPVATKKKGDQNQKLFLLMNI